MKLFICLTTVLLALAHAQDSQTDLVKDETVMPERAYDRDVSLYPKDEIEESLKKNVNTASAIANLAAAPSKVEAFTPISLASVSNVCQPKYSVYKVPNTIYYGGQLCWVYKKYWYSYIPYVSSCGGQCDVPKDSAANYYCVRANYKRFGVYLVCPQSGWVQYNFYMPQCCNCIRYMYA